MAPWPWWGAGSPVLGAQDIAFSRMSLGKMHPFCVVSPGGTDTGSGQTQLPLNHGLGFAASSTESKVSDIFPERQALDGNQIVFLLRHCRPVHRMAGLFPSFGPSPWRRDCACCSCPSVLGETSRRLSLRLLCEAPRRGAVRAGLSRGPFTCFQRLWVSRRFILLINLRQQPPLWNQVGLHPETGISCRWSCGHTAGF